MNAKQADPQDWWTLEELSRRWNTSVATLRRDADRADDDPRKLRHMPVGKAQIRVHIDEILRHEAPGKPGHRQETEVIVKPQAKQPKIRSLLEKRRAAARAARDDRNRQHLAV